MADPQFKTPLPKYSKRDFINGHPQTETRVDTPRRMPVSLKKRKDYYHTPGKAPYSSESEESIGSISDSGSSSGTATATSGCELSIVAEFDDLMRLMRQKRCDEVEDAFIKFVLQTKDLCQENRQAIQECQRLRAELESAIKINSDLENAQLMSRKILDKEKARYRLLERDRDALEEQINNIRELLFKNEANNKYLSNDTKEKLAFLSNTRRQSYEQGVKGYGNLTAIQELNSTGSILSDFSYSHSEDDLDVSFLQLGRPWKKHRPSAGGPPEPATKKRRSSENRVVEITSSDTVRATTTLTVNKEGPITATSVIESIPKHAPTTNHYKTEDSSSVPSAPPASLVFESWAHQDSPRMQLSNQRPHTFQQKMTVKPGTCGPCEKRIRFGKNAMKCKDCRATCHIECKNLLPLPCIPVVSTPNQGHAMGIISDYTPTIPPMVPALIVHCVNEIELRGTSELGLYRIPGSERDVKALKERFLKGRGAPCLNQTDIHVMCGTVKDFLRSLTEPLITFKLWKDFVKAVEAKDEIDVNPALYEILSQLPRPNRDTLAYMILHLQKIAKYPECKMPISNLAKVFGPTIVGYSSDDPDPRMLMQETVQQTRVMEYLLNIPSDYWSSFVNVNLNGQPSSKLQQTPSTDSLLRPISRGYLTPRRILTEGKRKQKFFQTPPMNK